MFDECRERYNGECLMNIEREYNGECLMNVERV